VCQIEWALSYEDYLYEVESNIRSKYVDIDQLEVELKIAESNPNFDWGDLLVTAKTLSRELYPEIICSVEASREYALQYILPAVRNIRREGESSLT
jgi:hypothetical protein